MPALAGAGIWNGSAWCLVPGEVGSAGFFGLEAPLAGIALAYPESGLSCQAPAVQLVGSPGVKPKQQT